MSSSEFAICCMYSRKLAMNSNIASDIAEKHGIHRFVVCLVDGDARGNQSHELTVAVNEGLLERTIHIQPSDGSSDAINMGIGLSAQMIVSAATPPWMIEHPSVDVLANLKSIKFGDAWAWTQLVLRMLSPIIYHYPMSKSQRFAAGVVLRCWNKSKTWPLSRQ